MEWFDRLKEVRLNNKKTQQDLAIVLKKDVTRISRYEKGNGAKNMPFFMKDGLLKIFTIDEISYIENGEEKPILSQNGKKNNQIVGNGNSIGSCTTKANKVITECLPADILNVVEMMEEMDKAKRRKVLRCVLDIENE